MQEDTQTKVKIAAAKRAVAVYKEKVQTVYVFIALYAGFSSIALAWFVLNFFK